MSPIVQLARPQGDTPPGVPAAPNPAAIPARDAPQVARFTGAWPEILWDLGCLGQVWVETGGRDARLLQTATLHGIRTGEGVAIARARGLALALFPDLWEALCSDPPTHPDRPPCRVWIEDRGGARLLVLTLAEGGLGFGLRTLLRTHGARRTRAAPVAAEARSLPAPPVPAPDPVASRGERWRALSRPSEPAEPDFADIAEVCGWLPLEPARLRERGRTLPADPSLVPCFLESLADQAVPVRVLAGTPGAAQALEGTFLTHGREGGWLRLGGVDGRLALRTAALDSAWVLTRGEGAGARRQLRLYDGAGQALALIEAAPGDRAWESPLWRTLVNALLG